MKIIIFTSGLLLFMAFPGWAMETQPLEEIRHAVQLFVEANVDNGEGETVVNVGRLDNRLRLARCEQPLQAYFPNGVRPMGNITVGIRCQGSKPWSLLVQTQIQHYVDVAVAARPLGRGGQLGGEDVVLRLTDVSLLNGGYFSSLQQAQGMVVKYPVKAGTVLVNTMLKPAILVKRGEKVMIRASSGAIEVSMEGKALKEGAKGDLIEVKNLSSGQTIEAEVVAPGLVRVRM